MSYRHFIVPFLHHDDDDDDVVLLMCYSGGRHTATVGQLFSSVCSRLLFSNVRRNGMS